MLFHLIKGLYNLYFFIFKVLEKTVYFILCFVIDLFLNSTYTCLDRYKNKTNKQNNLK